MPPLSYASSHWWYVTKWVWPCPNKFTYKHRWQIRFGPRGIVCQPLAQRKRVYGVWSLWALAWKSCRCEKCVEFLWECFLICILSMKISVNSVALNRCLTNNSFLPSGHEQIQRLNSQDFNLKVKTYLQYGFCFARHVLPTSVPVIPNAALPLRRFSDYTQVTSVLHSWHECHWLPFLCLMVTLFKAVPKWRSRMEGVAHNSFKNNKLLPSFLLLITHFRTQALYTLPFGLGIQNGKKKTNLLICHGQLSLSSLFIKFLESATFHEVILNQCIWQKSPFRRCGQSWKVTSGRGCLNAGEDGGDMFQGREVISDGKRKLLSHDLPLLIFNLTCHFSLSGILFSCCAMIPE